MDKLKLLFSLEFYLAIFDVLFKYIPIYFFVALFHKKKQCWLISERPTDARDNGFVLYKWIRTNHPEKKVVYAIKKTAKDYANVKDLGEVVEYGSFLHWFYYFASTVYCGTSWGICAPNSIAFLMMRNILPPKGKRVFLQHGITKDNMPVGHKNKLKADIFVCGAYPEWEYISREFGYSQGEVKYLGLTRFDRLINNAKKNQILFMPTWRTDLANVSDFESTDYYKTMISLLKSKELNDFLIETETEFVYFIHPAIRDKKTYFTNLGNSHIIILNNEDFDMQKLICSAKLLVTDFSSIYFDFAYQEKPVIYYHFDYENYRNYHYQEGYFSYENDGFGPIYKNEGDLIEGIKEVAKKDWVVDDEFHSRATRFFPIRDKNNCQRHYGEICKLDKSDE